MKEEKPRYLDKEIVGLGGYKGRAPYWKKGDSERI